MTQASEGLSGVFQDAQGDIWRWFFQIASIGMMITDLQKTVIEANPKLQELLGVSRAEILGTPLDRFIDSPGRGLIAEDWSPACLEGRLWERGVRVHKGDGSTLRCELHIGLLKKPTGEAVGYLVGLVEGRRKRKREELELKAAILDMATDAVLVRDMNNRIIYASYAVTRLNGYKPGELIGRDICALTTPAELPFFSARAQETEQKGELTFKSFHVKKDGTAVPVEIHSRMAGIGDQAVVISIVRDISVREQAEEELQLRALILDMATDAIYLRTLEGVILYVNQAACKITGYSRGELIDRNFNLLIPAEELDSYNERSRKIRDEGDISLESYHRCRDGRLVPVEIHSRPVKIGGRELIITVVRDITARRLVEEQLRASEREFRDLFNTMSEAVALISPEGIIIRANPAEAALFGLKSASEREGYFFRNPERVPILPGGAALSLEETAVERAIRTKSRVSNMEVGLRKPDGTTRWYNINASPVLDESGQLTAVVRTIADITEQKRLKDEREHYLSQITRVQEEERKRISRDLHDETAQYLSLLVLELDAFSRKESLPEELRSRLVKIKATTDQALQEVRRFSHELRPSILEHLGLAAALELIIDEMNRHQKMAVTFEVSGEDRRLPDEAELALFRIAQEALNNVRKHSGSVAARVSLIFTSRSVRLTISDAGKGFKPASQDEPGLHGGLGLTGMRERANLIGADFSLQSAPGRGTVVQVELKQ